MRLLYIEFWEFKPFSQPMKRYFKLTPTELVQVILGTNGSGKTCLMNEIIPKVAERSMFRAGGGKRAVYEHQHQEITLEYDYDSNRHKFIVSDGDDTENRNEGGTAKVQDELVREVFGITPLVRSILDGTLRFSSMSTAKRRELLTAMSPVSYDYVLGYYARAKERYNEAATYQRRLKKQLVDETALLMDPKRIQELETQVQTLHEQIEILYAERAPIERSSDDWGQAHNEAMARLQALSEHILRQPCLPPSGVTVTSLEALETTLGTLTGRLTQLQVHRKQISDAYAAIEQDFHVASSNSSVSASTLKLNLERMRQEIDGLVRRLAGGKLSDNYSELARGFAPEAYDELRTVFEAMPLNEDGAFSNTRFKELTLKLETLEHLYRDIDLEIARLGAVVERIEAHKQKDAVTCPECQHSFKAGFDAHQYEASRQALDTALAKRAGLQEEIQAHASERAEIQQFLEHYQRFLNVRAEYRNYTELWDELTKDHLAFKYPRLALQAIERFQQDSFVLQEILALDKRIESEINMLRLAEAVDATKVEAMGKDLAERRAEITTVTYDIMALTRELDALKAYGDQMRKLTHDHGAELQMLATVVEDTFQGRVQAARQESIHALVRQTQSQLAMAEDLLAQGHNQLNQIQRLEDQIAAVDNEVVVLNAMVQQISPNAGLIAESMMDYVNRTVDQINAVVNSIWSYPFMLQQCEFTEDGDVGLTYRFRIDIGDGANSIKDIAEGSKAQREVVDVAVRIVALSYLGFDNAMLVLDEFGDGFDPKHKTSAMNAVNAIIEQMSFSQVFIVSHSEESFGALKNNEVCLLCDANIQVRGVVNQHVEIR